MDLFDGVLEKTKNLLSGVIPETGKMFSHYLGRDNEEYDYPVSRLRSTKTVQESEKKNHDRLLNLLNEPYSLVKSKPLFSTVKTAPYAERYSLSDMHDGDEFYVEDYFDSDIEKGSVLRKKDFDLWSSLGSFKLRSNGGLRFKKIRDKILPYGKVKHNIDDIYDFHRGSSPDGTFGKMLEEKYSAEPYRVKARWSTVPLGVIKNRNGKADFSEVEWNILE